MKHADEESVDISKMSIWRFREYRRWLTLGTSHDFASAIKRFTFPMLTLMATGDPLLAGLVGTLGVASEAIAGLVGGGYFADHHPKLGLMMLASSVGAVWTRRISLHRPAGGDPG